MNWERGISPKVADPTGYDRGSTLQSPELMSELIASMRRVRRRKWRTQLVRMPAPVLNLAKADRT